VLIDTPGFDDTNLSDTDVLRMIAEFLKITYTEGMKLAGVIYFHRISDFRMGGISRRNFSMFRRLCGDSTLKNVVIVTNMWGEVTPEKGEARELELSTDDAFFKPALEKGAVLDRHLHTKESGMRILARVVDNHPLALKIQTELVDEKKALLDTAAGDELNREMKALVAKHKAEIDDLRRETREAMRQKDLETQQELQAQERKLKTEIYRLEEQSEQLRSEFSEHTGHLQSELDKLKRNGMFSKMGVKLDHVIDEVVAVVGRMMPGARRSQTAPQPYSSYDYYSDSD